MKKWKITLAQLAPMTLNVHKNAQRAATLMGDCVKSGSKLLVLPELYLTGYNISREIKEKVKKERLKNDISVALSALRKQSIDTGVDLMISYPLFENDAPPYIALEYIGCGRSLGLHKKINLCNYAQYTEHLHFQAGSEIVTASSESATAGLFICEDLWHITNAIFATKLGAEVLFYPSAATVVNKEDGKTCFDNWKKLTVGTAFSQTSFVVCCNQASNNSEYYFGGSHVISPTGDVLLSLPLFDEAVADVELDAEILDQVRSMRPLIANERFDVYRKYLS